MKRQMYKKGSQRQALMQELKENNTPGYSASLMMKGTPIKVDAEGQMLKRETKSKWQ